MAPTRSQRFRQNRLVAARWLPWLFGLGLVPLLLTRIRPAEIEEALRKGPSFILICYVFVSFLGAFVSDVAATRVGLTALGFRRPFREVLALRGAIYLAGLLSFTLGQAAIAYHLGRQRVRPSVAAGATFVLVLMNVIALGSLVLLGALCSSFLTTTQNRALMASAAAAVGVPVLFYTLRPRWLVKRSLLGPLFETEPAQHLKALAARLGYFILVTTLHWGALRVWGIEVPFFASLALIPILLFVVALPIAPNGIGTAQVTHVLLFSAFVPAATTVAREASALAFSLIQASTALLMQAILGYFFFLRWRRDHLAPVPPDPAS